MGGTSDSPAPNQVDSPPTVAEPVEAPLEDEFGPIDSDRWSQVPCAERRSLRVYELDTSDKALSEKEATAVRDAEQVFADALDEADGKLAPDVLQDLLEHINPTRSSHNCVECAMAVDDVLRGRPAAAGPTEDQQQHYLDAAMSARQIDYVEELEGDDVERLLLDAGPGARAIVIGWKNQHQSHAYNAVNFDGDVYWVDGQKNIVAEHDPHSFKTFDIYRTG
ncbi:toxin glutamine deamidase domain-containing protein [Tenggerimyces flavus]|uniref:Toxin glutamine deamidase domain-containing protein n=1 Tax=Tenggerimyces flavus TaxID=1708749 RepID=A0ABV7YM11_9ACTN|nr:toxin glutamine deamidase domain-containing protein [Tenggerimyces flavus]MBM7786293.1 hypothetical protein [Tenggerimyces flavus]